MNDEQGPVLGPEPLPEPGPELGPVSVPAAAQALGISERAVRKRIHAGTLRAQPFGRSFMVWLPDSAEEAGPEPGPAPRPEPGPEPIEAAYRVTPTEIEQAVSRTGAQYMGDLRTMFAEVGKVYEGRLAAKDEALTAKDRVISTQDETIATQRQALDDLRQRTEDADQRAREAVVRLADYEAAQQRRIDAVVAEIRQTNAARNARPSGSLTRGNVQREVDRQAARAVIAASDQPLIDAQPPEAQPRWRRLLDRLHGVDRPGRGK